MTAALLSPEAIPTLRRARRRPRRRTTVVVSGLALLLLGTFGVRVLLGDYTITIPDFFRIVTGTDIPVASFTLMESKLPRAVLGTMVGLALGTGGAIFQTTLRNPLASPDVIGVSIGASATAVAALLLFDLQGLSVSLIAVVGALAVALMIRMVAGEHSGQRLVLVGIGIAAALQSSIHYLFTRAQVVDVQLALRWMTGSLNAADWPTIRLLTAVLLVLLPLALWLSRSLRITELGEETAAGLGVRTTRTDALLLVAVVLIAVAVAAAGPIAFVSFLAGPIARYLNGGRTTIVGAALVGALIVVGADHVAAYHLGDVHYPVGVVTGAFGAPFLLWLIATGRTRRRSP